MYMTHCIKVHMILKKQSERDSTKHHDYLISRFEFRIEICLLLLVLKPFCKNGIFKENLKLIVTLQGKIQDQLNQAES